MAQRETFSAGAAHASTGGELRGRSGDFSRPNPEQGYRLMRAFLSVKQDVLREAIVKFVTELSTLQDKGP